MSIYILKNATRADYFGTLKKTVITNLLTWLFKAAKHYGGKFEKTGLKDFTFAYFPEQCGFRTAKLPELVHGNKLDNGGVL